MRQLVDDDQMAETRGGENGATVNIVTDIVTDIVTAAEAAAGKDTGSIGGEIETTRANRLHAVTAGLIGAEAAVGMRITADVTGTTEPREAEVAAGNIEGQREMDIVEDPQTDGGVLVLTAGGVKDEFQKPLEFKTASDTEPCYIWGRVIFAWDYVICGWEDCHVPWLTRSKDRESLWVVESYTHEQFSIPTYSTYIEGVEWCLIAEVLGQ